MQLKHRTIFDNISANGALNTQFPFNLPGTKQSFPISNRIVSAMTLGTVVVEAIGLLAALLLPVLSRAKIKARQIVSISQFRQLGLAVWLYTGETNGLSALQAAFKAA
jgi:hypothetical protein